MISFTGMDDGSHSTQNQEAVGVAGGPHRQAEVKNLRPREALKRIKGFFTRESSRFANLSSIHMMFNESEWKVKLRPLSLPTYSR